MRKIWAVIIAAVMALAFFGCTKDGGNYDADIIADALNSELQFGEELEKSTQEAAYSIYGVDSSLCTKAAFYAGSSATADEIAVFNCVDDSARQTVADAVQARIDYLREGYGSYGPDQVPKIDSASVITKGNTVIICICENSDAVQGVIDSASNK